MSVNLIHAKMTAGDLLETIIAAHCTEKPNIKAIHVEEAEHQLERLARELGFRVERVTAPAAEVA